METNLVRSKIDREIPSTLAISEHLLPQIKDWEVGKTYMVKLSVECTSLSKRDEYDPEESSETRARFKVIGAHPTEMAENRKEESSSKESFLRAAGKLADKYL